MSTPRSAEFTDATTGFCRSGDAGRFHLFAVDLTSATSVGDPEPVGDRLLV